MTTFFDLLFTLIIIGFPAAVAITWIKQHYAQLTACNPHRLETEYRMRELEVKHAEHVLSLPADGERR